MLRDQQIQYFDIVVLYLAVLPIKRILLSSLKVGRGNRQIRLHLSKILHREEFLTPE
jgi:hypothetical protein